MSTLQKTEVFFTDSNNRYQGKRHAVIEMDTGTFHRAFLKDGKETTVYIPSKAEERDDNGILTVQIAGEIFYRTGKNGTNRASGMPVLEMESYTPSGKSTGHRLWIDTTGNNVFAD